jgi:hypothetical protein
LLLLSEVWIGLFGQMDKLLRGTIEDECSHQAYEKTKEKSNPQLFGGKPQTMSQVSRYEKPQGTTQQKCRYAVDNPFKNHSLELSPFSVNI